jgi:hypothetical protein
MKLTHIIINFVNVHRGTEYFVYVPAPTALRSPGIIRIPHYPIPGCHLSRDTIQIQSSLHKLR